MYEPYLGDPNAIKPKQREQAMPYRLATIVRTNTTEAMAEGLKDAVEPAIKSGYVIGFQSSAILDDRTTEVCQYLHGRFFRVEGEETALLTPPRHWNCRSIMIPITKDEGPVKYITSAQIGKALGMMPAEFGGKQ
jgi:SPP1 gp7 family putative phage head morphogenesis protein